MNLLIIILLRFELDARSWVLYLVVAPECSLGDMVRKKY